MNYYSAGVEFNVRGGNPMARDPCAKLFVAVLYGAIDDIVNHRSSDRRKAQAWRWLREDDVIIDYCLSVVDVDRDRLIKRVKFMEDNGLGLKSN